MMKGLKRLCDLPLKQQAVVVRICCHRQLIDRIYDMGITEGCTVTPLFRAPFGDPSAYAVKHTLIALRRNDSKHIWVRCEDEL